MATPNMNLTLPTVSVTAGPLYATENNEAFEAIDAHDHTSGKGVLVPVAGLNINADLSMEGFDLTTFRSLRCQTQAAALATGSDVECYYSVAGVPYYNNAAGGARQLVAVTAPYVIGDIFYATSTTAVSRLAIGSAGQVLKSSGTAPAWQSVGSSLSISVKTSNYTLTSTDDDVVCNASGGSFTLTLPDAAANAGKVYKIYRKDATFANTLTVARAGSDTLSFNNTTATSYILYTVNEYIEIQSDGTSTWYVLDHQTITPWTSYTPTIGAGWGSTSNSNFHWKRSGDSILIKGFFTSGTLAASSSTITLPAGVTVSATKFTAAGTMGFVGPLVQAGGGGSAMVTVLTTGDATVLSFGLQAAGNAGLIVQNASAIASLLSSSNTSFTTCEIPITGWNA